MKQPVTDLRAALRSLPAAEAAELEAGFRSVEASRGSLLSPYERQCRIDVAATIATHATLKLPQDPEGY